MSQPMETSFQLKRPVQYRPRVLDKDLHVPATTIHGRLKKLGVVFGQRKSR